MQRSCKEQFGAKRIASGGFSARTGIDEPSRTTFRSGACCSQIAPWVREIRQLAHVVHPLEFAAS